MCGSVKINESNVASCFRHNWLAGTLPAGAHPVRRTRGSVIKVMEELNEQDQEQMFWEIQLYAERNKQMHGGVLDAINLFIRRKAQTLFTTSRSNCKVATYWPTSPLGSKV